jgi:transcriptional regulator with GAF, ATPase, and Fis domain/tetratricopeptide (TPR) repeat protein
MSRSFEPIERFAAGGDVEVARVRLADGREALRKRFAAPAPALFRTEIECLARVASPNVTAILDAGIDADGSPWLLREFVPGATLRAWLAPARDGSAPRLDARRRGEILHDLLAGLAAIHREGLVHGDLKPENVLVPEQGPARLSDFGLASVAVAIAARGMSGGSAFYVAPERILGWPIDARADLFSFGVLLFELLGGSLPADPGAFYARFPRDAFLECVAPPPADARALEVVRRCTQVDPLLRPGDVESLRRELAAAGLVAGAESAAFLPRLPDDFFLRPLVDELARRLDAPGSSPRLRVRLDSEADFATLTHAVTLLAAVRGLDFVGPGRLEAVASAKRGALVLARATRDLVDELAPRLVRGEPLALVVCDVGVDGGGEPESGAGGLFEAVAAPPADARALARSLLGRGGGDAEPPLPLVRLCEELARRGGRSAPRVNRLLAALVREGHLRASASGVELIGLEIPWDRLAVAAPPPVALAPGFLRVARLLELSGEPHDPASFAALCAAAGVAPLAARAELAKAGVLSLAPDGVGCASGALPPPGDEERRDAARTLLEHESATRQRPDRQLLFALRAGETARAAVLVATRHEELGRRGADRLAPILDELLAATDALARGPAGLLVASGRLFLKAGRVARGAELFAAVDALGDAPAATRLEALRWLGEASLLLANLDAAQAAFAAGRRLARGDDELPFVRGLADARMRAGDPAGALRLLDRSERGSERRDGGPATLAELQIEGLRALALIATDSLAEAAAVLKRALAAARPLGNPALLALLLTNLALLQRREGRLAAAIDATREALALQEERGQLHEVALLHQNLGVYLKEVVRGAEARQHFATALELRRALGDGHGVAVGHANLGLFALEIGLLAEAATQLAAAAPLMARHGQPREKLLHELGELKLDLRRGRWRAISRRLASLRERALAGGFREVALEATLLLFERQLAAMRLEAAAEEFTRAEGLAAAMRDLRSEPRLQLHRAQLKRALGTSDAAQAQLDALRVRVRGTALECEELLEEVATGGPPPPLDRLEAAERAARVASNRHALAEALRFRRAWHRARLDRHGAAAAERALRDVLAEVTGGGSDVGQARALAGFTTARRAAHRLASHARHEEEDEMAHNLELLRTFLSINRRLANEADLPRLLDYLVDTALALAGGERGFLVLESDGKTAFEVSRSLRGGEIPAPERELSASFLKDCLASGRPLVTSNAGLDPRFRERASVAKLDLRSILCVPLRVDDSTLAALYVDNPVREGVFGDREMELVEALADQASIALRNLAARRRIEAMNEELARRVELQESALAIAERDLGRAGLDKPQAGGATEGWIGRSPAFVAATRLLERFAATDLSVLVTGESGTGKERAARLLHERSARRARPFVSESCSAIPETLLEAEFFGVKKGAFTGADRDRPGLFELARGGTLFLDEIGELPLALQVKLLRVLEERAVRPLGGSAPVAVDFRLVCATNRDLRALVREGKFREDLFFRVAVGELRLPPLRERSGDVAPLAESFLARRNAEHGTKRLLPPETAARMERYAWPGNVRELRNEIDRAFAIAEGDRLEWQPPDPLRDSGAGLRWPEPMPTLQELERLAIAEGLARTKGDKEATARQLGISRASIYDKIRRYGLRPDPGPKRPES